MGKRYYCEYCDKTMVSAPSIIKTHIKGVVHQKLVSEHYQQYKDPETILKEESTKKPCTKFARGECQFGGICRYSHYTSQELHELSLQVAAKKEAEEYDLNTNLEGLNTGLQDISSNEKNTIIYDEHGVTHIFPWTYNSMFDSYDDLPPSIKRLKSADLSKTWVTYWG